MCEAHIVCRRQHRFVYARGGFARRFAPTRPRAAKPSTGRFRFCFAKPPCSNPPLYHTSTQNGHPVGCPFRVGGERGIAALRCKSAVLAAGPLRTSPLKTLPRSVFLTRLTLSGSNPPLITTKTKETPRGCLFRFGGERGIRTPERVLAVTRFPVVRLRPAQPSLRAVPNLILSVYIRRLIIITKPPSKIKP